MKTNTIEFEVELGDTDSQGVVFYPKYFSWFDRATNAFLKAHGLSHSTLHNQYHYAHPVVECSCQFIHPLRCDSPVRIETTITELRDHFCKLQHVIYSGDLMVASGYEVRTWVQIDQPEQNHRFVAADLPIEVVEKLKA